MDPTALTHASVPPGPATRWALFLDIDGTLLDIAPTPEEVVVPPGLGATLNRLFVTLGGALAFVSGRTIESIDRLFSPLRLPAAGQHGAEIRVSERECARLPLPSDTLADLRVQILAYAASFPGVRVEDKGLGFAVHYRQAPAARARLENLLSQIVASHGRELELLQGKSVLEIRSRNANKGRALEVLMKRPPFAGRVPVFIGDDRTDEDGFQAAERLRGHAVRVGAEHASAGGFWLPETSAVRAWLQRLAEKKQFYEPAEGVRCKT